METITPWLVFLFRTLVLFVIPLAFLLIKGTKRLKFNALVEKIPGPKALPLIGNAVLMSGRDLTGLFVFIHKKGFSFANNN